MLPASSPTRSQRSGSPRGRQSQPGRSSSSSSIVIRWSHGPCSGSRRPYRAASRRRLDPWRGKLAGDLLGRLPGSEHDSELGEALERWELSLFESEPLRSDRLREALSALLGGVDGLWAAAMRAAVLVGEITEPAARARVDGILGLARGVGADAETVDAVRRIFIETVLADDRPRFLASLDEALLGLRGRARGLFLGAGAVRRDGIGTELPRSRASRPSTVGTWTRPGACWRGWSGSRRSTGERAQPGDLLAELRALLTEAEAWARAERTVPEDGDRCRGTVPGDALPAGKHGGIPAGLC